MSAPPCVERNKRVKRKGNLLSFRMGAFVLSPQITLSFLGLDLTADLKIDAEKKRDYLLNCEEAHLKYFIFANIFFVLIKSTREMKKTLIDK